MKTVQDYLDLGLVFVVGDKGYKHIIESFAWRNNDGVKPEYKGLIHAMFENGVIIQDFADSLSWVGSFNPIIKWRPVVLQSDNAKKEMQEKFLSALQADTPASKNVWNAIREQFCLPVGIDSPELREAFKSLKEHLENKPPFWDKSIQTLNCPCVAVDIEAIKSVSPKEDKQMKPVYTAEMHAKGELPTVGAECLTKVDNSLRFNKYTVMYISNSGSMVLRRVESEIDLVVNTDSCEFKPIIKTIKVNGFDVPAPMSESPERGSEYFIPSINNGDFFGCHDFHGDIYDKRCLSRGLIHLTKSAAIAHAKAMLGIDPNA